MPGPSLRMRKKSPVDAGTEPTYEEKIRVPPPPPGSLCLYCVGNVRDLILQCNLITDWGGGYFHCLISWLSPQC